MYSHTNVFFNYKQFDVLPSKYPALCYLNHNMSKGVQATRANLIFSLSHLYSYVCTPVI